MKIAIHTKTNTAIVSRKLEKLFAEVEKDIEAGQNISPVFFSAEEMDKYLSRDYIKNKQDPKNK